MTKFTPRLVRHKIKIIKKPNEKILEINGEIIRVSVFFTFIFTDTAHVYGKLLKYFHGMNWIFCLFLSK